MGSMTLGIGSDPVLLLRARRLAEQRQREEEARAREEFMAERGGASMGYDVSLDQPEATKVSETRTIPPEVARRRLIAGRPRETGDDLSLAANQRTAELMDAEEQGFYRAQEQTDPQGSAQSPGLRYRVGGGEWRSYDGSAPNVGRGVATPGLIANAFRGSDAPDWRGPSGLRSAAQMEQDIGARDLLDETYGVDEEAERSVRAINARRLAAQALREEQAAARESVDPYGIQEHVARKMAEFQASRMDPQEQRRAAADARRASGAQVQAQRLARLRERLAEGNATPEEQEAAISQFARSTALEAAMEEAQRTGNFASLAALLRETGV